MNATDYEKFLNLFLKIKEKNNKSPTIYELEDKIKKQDLELKRLNEENSILKNKLRELTHESENNVELAQHYYDILKKVNDITGNELV